MPVDEVDEVIDPLIGAYQKSYERVSSQLVGVADDPNQWRKTKRLREVRASIDRELTYLNQEIAPRAVQATYWANELGFGTGAVGAGAQVISWDLVDRGAVEVLAKGMYEDLLKATSLVDQTSKSLLRKLGRDASLGKLLEGRTAVQAGRSMARQAKDLGVYAVTYVNGARHGLDEYAAMSMRTVTANAYNGALVDGAVAEKCNWFEIMDGPDCGLTFHEDPQIADGLIVDDDTARTWRISHPNCRRTFGPRPDVNNKKEAAAARRSTTASQRADQIAADQARGLPVRPSAQQAAVKQSRLPVQKPSKASQPHRTPKAAQAARATPMRTVSPSLSGYGELSDYRRTGQAALRGSPEELDALFQYTQFGTHYEVNNPLRTGGTLNPLTKKLDAVTGKNRLEEGATLYRGVDSEDLRNQLLSAEPGSRVLDRGFTSASADREVVEDFIFGGDSPVIMEILAPPTTRGAYIGPHFENRAGFYNQEEFVFARGTEFSVEKITQSKDGPLRAVLRVAAQEEH